MHIGKLIGGLLVGSAMVGCGVAPQSETKDIFTNDHETRRGATDDETLWTVYVGGCTGSMLTDRYMLTANHCSPYPGQSYQSGPALVDGSGNDLRAVNVVERSSSFDYAIVEVSWTNSANKDRQKYSPFIQTSEDQVTTGRDGERGVTELVTVGFPVDKRGQGPQHAVGYAKNYWSNSLIYNIGIINGNSGGAVWRTEDMMLVSQTNFGPNAYGQPGWNNNNPEDSGHWNGGGRMDKMYAQSRILKEIFPDGDNQYVDDEGNLE